VVCGTTSHGNRPPASPSPDAGLTRRIGWGERPHEGRRAMAAHARHGHRGQDAGPWSASASSPPAPPRRQGVRHEVIAWSQNLTPGAMQGGRRRLRLERTTCSKNADFLSIHVQLGERNRGLITARELGLMKKTGLSDQHLAGPIVEEKALIEP